MSAAALSAARLEATVRRVCRHRQARGFHAAKRLLDEGPQPDVRGRRDKVMITVPSAFRFPWGGGGELIHWADSDNHVNRFPPSAGRAVGVDTGTHESPGTSCGTGVDRRSSPRTLCKWGSASGFGARRPVFTVWLPALAAVWVGGRSRFQSYRDGCVALRHSFAICAGLGAEGHPSAGPGPELRSTTSQ
jgi:hypothetical protein